MDATSTDLGLTAFVSAGALLAVWVPFYRGLRLCFRARRATRVLSRSQLQQGLRGRSGERDSIALLMMRVLSKSLRENDGSVPSEFVVDASRQYASNEYESHYARPISMFANLLPPIGFIGTTGGLFILFLSMHTSNTTLELGALAMALTSSIFALIAFAVLESWKIRLYSQLLCCLDDALSHQRAGGERAGAPPAGSPATSAG
jgi:hypothetical protein